MIKFLKRKFLYFSFAVLLVLIAGFFVVFSESNVFEYKNFLNQIKFFTAGLSFSPSVSETEIQTPDFAADDPPQEIESEELPEVATAATGTVLGLSPSIPSMSIQEKLDDIAEKIDIIQRQIADLATSNLALENSEPKEQNILPDALVEEEIEEIKESEKIIEQPQLAVEPIQNVTTGGGGGGGVREAKPVYPKILISEIQTSGQAEKEEFVELFNPNDTDIDLTDWYLQKKTKGAPPGSSDYSSYASSSLLSGKKILAKNYFLICREEYNPNGLCNVGTIYSLSEDNTLVFKNPNREISDKAGWGDVLDFEGAATQNPGSSQSIGRKWDGSSEPASQRGEQDTDNNFLDFELNTPSPKANNIAYVAPENLEPSVLKNVLINEIQVNPIEQRFIELYNANDTDINLTGWYLQRKTENDSTFASFVSSPNFDGKIIPANGYFLISRERVDSDILLSISLNDNDFLALKNSGKDIIDEASWEKSPDEGRSLGRKFDQSLQGYLDTGDNLADFEIDSPSPKAKNITFVEPAPEPKDTTAPGVVFNLDATQNNLTFTINFEITDPLDAVTPSGLESYIFRWKEETGDWQEDPAQEIVGFPTPHNAQRDFTGESGKTYYFQIKAKDIEGNESEWLPEVPAITTIDVIAVPDTTPPTGTILINDGALYTNSRDVILTISATDDMSEVVEMKIANGSSYHDWEPYAISKAWQLPATEGLKTVRVKFKDAAGNETTPGIPATIILDTTGSES